MKYIIVLFLLIGCTKLQVNHCFMDRNYSHGFKVIKKLKYGVYLQKMEREPYTNLCYKSFLTREDYIDNEILQREEDWAIEIDCEAFDKMLK